MHRQLIALFLVALAASVYGLDLNHAVKRSTDIEPRVLNAIGDLYAQAIFPPLKQIVETVALLFKKVLAALHQYGIPTSAGRSLPFSEADLRAGFWSGLWNDALKPPIENALTGLSLMTAQVLAGVGLNGINLGLGKRDLTEAELRGIGDVLTQALNDVFANVIQKPLEDALQGGALMLAQVLAGLGTNGVNLGGLLGKRELTEAELRGFGDVLTQALNDVFANVIQKPLEDALQGGALMLAQVLAGLGTNGVNLGGLLGKRELTEAELRGFGDVLTQALNDVFANVIQKPLEDALQGGALMLAQVLAGLGTNGVNLGGLLGKRELTEAELRGFGDVLTQALNDVFANVIQKPLEDALQGGALMLAQVLAGLGTNGVNLGGLLGKRELTEADLLRAGFWSGLWNDALKPPIENALTGLSLMTAQVLAGVGLNGINLGLGKRDLTEAELRGIGDVLTQALNDVFANVIQKPLEDALQGGALMLAQVLAGLGTNGVNLSGLLGKRDLTEAELRGIGDIFTEALNNVFTNVLQKPLEDALQGGALMLAQVLAGLGTNGVNLGGLLGKRDVSDLVGHEAELRGIFGTVGGAVVSGLQGVWNNIIQVPLENFVQTGALSVAQILANLGTNGVSLGKREAEARGPIIDSLTGHISGLYETQVKPLLENALGTAALHLAGVLANFSQTGLGRR